MNETVEVEYIKPALYKRWFSSIIDFMLVILFGILFFSFSSLISKHIPSYISNVNERNEIQNNTPLYDDSGSLIILSVEKSSDTYTQKKNILNSVIEEFYKDKNFFKDNVTYYSSYQERKKKLLIKMEIIYLN